MDKLYIVLIILCLVLSAFFSGTEIAFAKVNKIKLARAVEQKEGGAKLANHFANNYNDFITVILIGNNLVNIAASSMATILFVHINPNNGELLATLVMTFAVLLFGEILPKTIFSAYSYRFCKIFAVPLRFFEIILFPLTFIVQKSLNGFNKLLKKHAKEDVTDDELIEMVDTMEEQGLIDEDTQELVTNAIDLIDCDAVEIMVHRSDVFDYDIDDDLQELIDNPRLLNYSRIPVYQENYDNVLGILNTKQLIKLHLNGDSINIREILTEPLYVYQTQPVTEVLKIMRQEHIHMAIVKDEYGGNLGILTMEDILEELVGDIYDEMDEEETLEYHKVNDSRFTVDGDMNIFDFFDLINYKYDDYESIYTTVGGWVIDKIEHFPKVKDSFDFEGYRITVIKATKFTVERISVLKLEIDE